MIRRFHVTSANRAEVREFEHAITDAGNGQAVFADKGYASQANRDWLKKRGILDAIILKASPRKRLDNTARNMNRLSSKLRYKVEQCFGTLKRRFGFERARYRTAEKVESECCWRAMCFNLRKAQLILQACSAQIGVNTLYFARF